MDQVTVQQAAKPLRNNSPPKVRRLEEGAKFARLKGAKPTAKRLRRIVRDVVMAAERLADGQELMPDIKRSWQLKNMRGVVRISPKQTEQLEDWILARHEPAELLESQLFTVRECDKSRAHVFVRVPERILEVEGDGREQQVLEYHARITFSDAFLPLISHWS